MNLRRRRPEAPEAVEPVELVEAIAEPEAAVDADESPTVRALRAQVRVLEQALEVAPDVPVPTADDAAYRNRVVLAVRAVAARADDHDDPRHVAARVLAAVERLEAAGFSRPVLPGVASRTIAAPPPPLSAAAQPPALPPAAAPVVDESPETGPEVPAEEIVVPVPPPAQDEPRRSRRRQRHPAA